MSRSLLASERELVVAIADDEPTWTVFMDSKRAAATRLLKVAQALGIMPERVGHGWQFTLPLKAVRFVVPRTLTEAEVAKRRASVQNLVKHRGNGGKIGIPEGARGDARYRDEVRP